ncbi:MAG: hypothetical protein WEG36_13895 [Gemmatimonadota bacterium]
MDDPNSTDPIARRNRLVGWSLFLAGIAGGMVLGLWAFDGPAPAPARFAEYDGLPRRLLRLGHIAAMALGLTNIFFGHELPGLALGRTGKKVASASLICGATLMPAILTAAAFHEPWKYLLPLPATATFVAVALICAGLVRERRPA